MVANLMAGTWTKEGNVLRSIKAGRQRQEDARLSPIVGVAEAIKVRDKVTANMIQQSLDPLDARVYLVFSEPDLSGLFGERLYVPPNAALDTKMVRTLRRAEGKLPLGLLIYLVDKSNPEQYELLGQKRPFIVNDARGPALLAIAYEATKPEVLKAVARMGAVLLKGVNDKGAN